MLPIAMDLCQCWYLTVKVNQNPIQEAGVPGSGPVSVAVAWNEWSGQLGATDSSRQPGSGDRYLQEVGTLGNIP